MNDDELGRILQGEMHRRIGRPASTPDSVYRHFEDLQSMEPVRRTGMTSQHHRRDLLGLAAAVAICVLVAAGLALRPSDQPGIPASGPKDGIEAFARVDPNTAWAESGSILYVTRDGGRTWSEGTVPGGLSPAAYFRSLPTPAVVEVTPAGDAGATAPIEPTADHAATPTLDPATLTPDHYYPDFVDADHGWLLSWKGATVGGSAQMTMTVWRTGDGGKHWDSSQVPGVYKGVGVIQFVDQNHGWITVIRTDRSQAQTSVDGATPPPASALPADSTTILATDDGGVTWTTVSTLPALALARFVSPTEGWGYAQNGTSSMTDSVIHTTDGGRSWTTATLPLPGGGSVAGWPQPPTVEGANLVIRLLYQVSSGAGVSAQVLTFTSRTAGTTWDLTSKRDQTGEGWTQVNSLAPLLAFPSGQPIVLSMGRDPSAPDGFRATFDGGLTWSEYSTEAISQMGVSLAEWTSPDDVWVMPSSNAMGGSYMLGGRIYSSRDGGRTWKLLLGSESTEPQALKTPQVVYITPTPGQPSEAPTPTLSAEGSGKWISEMGRIDASNGWVVIHDNAVTDWQIQFTGDAGTTWSPPRVLPAGSDLQFADLEHGWSLKPADAGQLIVQRTTDGGASWTETLIDTKKSVGSTAEWEPALHFRDELHGEAFFMFGPTHAPSSGDWACDRYSTDDAGATWTGPISMPCLSNIAFVDDGFGYATQQWTKQVLFVTTDGGQTWTSGSLPDGLSVATSPNPVALMERNGDGSLRALLNFVDGSGGLGIVTSADGGRTWTSAGSAQGLPLGSLQASALSARHWLASVSPLSSDTMVLASTSDGGLSWTILSSPSLPANVVDIRYLNETDGWVVVSGANCRDGSCPITYSGLYATGDGGTTWKAILEP